MALDLEYVTVTFSGGTVSTVGKLGIKALVGIVLPSAWVGTGGITFNASPVNDGVNFYPLTDQLGNAIAITPTASSRFCAISNLSQFAGINMIQLVTTPAQTCTVTLLVRSVAF